MAEHEHDGIRRWAVYYQNPDNSRGTFYSDAVTEPGARVHFKQSCPSAELIYTRTVCPNEWLDQR